jgi:hypothetical protein
MTDFTNHKVLIILRKGQINLQTLTLKIKTFYLLPIHYLLILSRTSYPMNFYLITNCCGIFLIFDDNDFSHLIWFYLFQCNILAAWRRSDAAPASSWRPTRAASPSCRTQSSSRRSSCLKTQKNCNLTSLYKNYFSLVAN